MAQRHAALPLIFESSLASRPEEEVECRKGAPNARPVSMGHVRKRPPVWGLQPSTAQFFSRFITSSPAGRGVCPPRDAPPPMASPSTSVLWWAGMPLAWTRADGPSRPSPPIRPPSVKEPGNHIVGISCTLPDARYRRQAGRHGVVVTRRREAEMGDQEPASQDGTLVVCSFSQGTG